MTLKQIVQRWLTENSYDGLYHQDGECACATDNLMRCGEPGENCKAGYRQPCDCGEGCDFHIGKEKQVDTL
jgi:hypothetical protein